MNRCFHLDHFVQAQDLVYDAVLNEIKSGKKHGHWMWFIFPQIAGLGSSMMAQRYAISSLAEAKAYLDHPILGTRLRACVEALQDTQAANAEDIFGRVDAMKLRSSLTLFAQAGIDPLFSAALDRWFGGKPDPLTLVFLRRPAAATD